jgi:TonB family protein
MSDSSSGLPLPSRDAQEFRPASPSNLIPADHDNGPRSKASLALAILSEKIKSGALKRSELVDRIVSQAFAATGAKGIALALRREHDGLVVCCAAAGDMAPPKGTVLDEGSGLTAECLRNGVLMICEDSQVDERVDRVACSRLGVRSIVAAPVENEGTTVGILEALSDQPGAFTKQHIEVLLTLACFAKSAVADRVGVNTPNIHSAVPAAAQFTAEVIQATETAPGRETDLLDKIDDLASWSQRVPRRVRLAIAGAVAAALLLALCATAVFVWMWKQNSTHEIGNAAQPKSPQVVVTKPSAAISTKIARSMASHRNSQGVADVGRRPLLSKASAVEKIADETVLSADSHQAEAPAPVEDAPAPEMLRAAVNESNAELSGILASPERLPSAAAVISDGVTPARLQHRVEPAYPADAKRLRIEGAVVLRAGIDENGKVRSVGVVKGSPLLAKAAMDAVRQWQYRPSELNHHALASTTDITIVFHLQ